MKEKIEYFLRIQNYFSFFTPADGITHYAKELTFKDRK